MADEIGELYKRLAALERNMNNMVRIGTVEKGETGKAKVKWQDGDGGTSGSPKMRLGVAGFMNAHMPMPEGQTVISVSVGGNHDYGVLIPAGHSDQFPKGKNWSQDAYNFGFPKPPEDNEEEQQQDDSGSSGGGGSQYKPQEGKNKKKWELKDENHQGSYTHEKFNHKIGDAEVDMSPNHAQVKHGKTVIKATKEEATMMVGDVGVQVKGGDIYLIGNVYLGSKNSKLKVATEETRDSMGGKLLPPFSNKAKTE